MNETDCFDHRHVLRENEVTLAREIGRKKYDGEDSHRPELSVWAWVVLRPSGMVCHGYGSEPSYGKKQYMENSWQENITVEKESDTKNTGVNHP